MTPAHQLLESLRENPDPGAKYCPACLKDSFTRRVRCEGSATDMQTFATCGHCHRESFASKWLNWNEALEDARERVRVVEGVS